MRKWILLTAVFLVGGTFIATEVEARRLGGGRNAGAQRNVTAPPAQTPAKQQTAQGQQQQPAQAAPARTPWGGILGGLALGGLLGYFLGGGGLMGSMLGILLLAGVVMLAIMAFRAFAARRQEAPQHLQYAGMRETVSVPATGSPMPMSAQPSVPAGFDAAGFLRAAKLNFLKLQMANDAGALDEIREFTTGELFEELRKDVASSAATQHTQVSSLEAELLEVANDGGTHWASVRFSGQVSEERNAAPVPFQEIWNLMKPADGSSGWLLAGIQQMH